MKVDIDTSEVLERQTTFISFDFFFFQAEDGIRDLTVTGVQTCALPIFIPKIKLDAVITEGTSHTALTLGPGHLQESAVPGDIGNSVIAAHRDTFFRHIYELNAGDDIYVERHGKQFHYVVTEKRVVQPTDVSVLDNSSEARLTLITCYPVYFIGPAPERLVIFAKLAKQV